MAAESFTTHPMLSIFLFCIKSHREPILLLLQPGAALPSISRTAGVPPAPWHLPRAAPVALLPYFQLWLIPGSVVLPSALMEGCACSSPLMALSQLHAAQQLHLVITEGTQLPSG